MIADLGTRKGAKTVDVSEESKWMNGLPWMRLEKSSFPVLSVQEIKLSKHDVESIQRESLRPQNIRDLVNGDSEECASESISSHPCRKIDSKKLHERYEFLNFIIDPNRFRLRKVVRILALVMLYIRKLWQKARKLSDKDIPTDCSEIQIPEMVNGERYVVTSGHSYKVSNDTKNVAEFSCKPGLVIILKDTDLKKAFEYFYKKATLELIEFAEKQSYKNNTEMRDNILYYTGRILPSQEFGGNLSTSDVIMDLSASTFLVPVIDSSSPLAFSIVNEVHWYDPVANHSGNEAVLRYTKKYAHIVEGRELVKRFRKDCPRCRILAKRTIDIVMGPVSKVNLLQLSIFHKLIYLVLIRHFP